MGSEKMPEISGLMRGKRSLIIGVANQRSLAWGIAKACHAHGAEVAFTYQGNSLKKRVEPLAPGARAASWLGIATSPTPATIDAVFAKLQSAWGDHRLPCPRHRLFGQGPARRPLCRHHRRELRQHDADQLLFADRDRASAPKS